MASTVLMSYTHTFEAEAPKEAITYVHDGTEFVSVTGEVYYSGGYGSKDTKIFIDGEWKQITQG